MIVLFCMAIAFLAPVIYYRKKLQDMKKRLDNHIESSWKWGE